MGKKDSGHNDGNHDKRQAEKAKAQQLANQQVANVISNGGVADYNPAPTMLYQAPSSQYDPNNGYNPSRSFIEAGPIRPEAFDYGMSNYFKNKISLPTSTLEGATQGELNLMLTSLGKSMDYEADYGLRELQGDIDRGLAKMEYENDQLKTDKMIDNSVWLDRTKNIAANRQQREMTNAQVLSNL